MRILFITHYFAPDSGAAANRLTRLAQHLQARGHDVTVLTTIPHYPTGIVPPEYRGKFMVVENRDGMQVIQVWLWTTRSSRIIWRLLSQLSFMLTCILRGLFLRQPDVIFIENQPIFTGFAGWFISKIKRRPYLLNVSDYWPEYLVVAGVVKETSITYRIFKGLANRIQRDADGIVTLLDNLLTKIEDRIGKVSNSRVIYNAVELDRFVPTQDATEGFLEAHNLSKVRLITFLGVLGPHIDLDTMLATARNFAGRQDIHFLFVGSGTQKTQLDQALQASEFEHCITIDWLDYSDVPAFWSASYIHYWALHDNELDKMRFQAKLYEALASGTPTVIAVEGLMSEFLALTETGITVPPSNADALTHEIERLLEDDAHYAHISQNARAYAEANFDIKVTVDAYEDMLKQLSDKDADK